MLVTGPISRWCKVLTLMAQSAAVECNFSRGTRVSFSWLLVSGVMNAYVAAETVERRVVFGIPTASRTSRWNVYLCTLLQMVKPTPQRGSLVNGSMSVVSCGKRSQYRVCWFQWPTGVSSPVEPSFRRACLLNPKLRQAGIGPATLHAKYCVSSSTSIVAIVVQGKRFSPDAPTHSVDVPTLPDKLSLETILLIFSSKSFSRPVAFNSPRSWFLPPSYACAQTLNPVSGTRRSAVPERLLLDRKAPLLEYKGRKSLCARAGAALNRRRIWHTEIPKKASRPRSLCYYYSW